MGQLLGYGANISGTSGSYGFLEPKGSYRVYVFPQGAHASASSTGQIITVGSTQAASRLTNGHWVQVGTDPANVRRVSAVVPTVQGNTVTVTASVTVAAGDRIYLIGVTQPTVSGSSVTYQPNTTIYSVDESENATPVANSLLTTDSNGAFQFWPSANGFYDAIIQDSRVTNVGSLVDIEIGVVGTPLLPIQGRTDDIGSAALPWDDITMSGKIISAVTSGSGVTYHRFDTTGGITGGALFQFANNGATRIYGDSWGGLFHSYTVPHVFNVKSARFGAAGDGTTDDTAAIVAAIAAAAASENGATGGIVYFPKGTYITNSLVALPSRVRLVGEGRRNSILKAGGSFPTNTALVRIGSGGDTFEATIENMALNCNNIAGSIAIGSTVAQEGSGPRNVIIQNYEATGISYSGAGCQNWVIQGVEFFHTNTSAVGIDMDTVGSNNMITDVTFNSNDSSVSTSPAIRLITGTVNMQRIHVERHITGISVGTGGNGSVIGFFGHSTVDDCVSIGEEGFIALDVAPNGATVSINNRVTGESYSSNGGGWYFLSNDGGAFPSKSRFSSSQSAQSVLMSPTRFGNTLTCSGQLGVTGAASFSGVSTLVGGSFIASGNVILEGGGSVLTASGAGVLTLGTGSWFGISGTGTAVTSIAPVTSGRMVVLIASAGSQAFNDGAGLHVNGSPMTLAASGNPDSTMFFCAGATWVQIGPQAA